VLALCGFAPAPGSADFARSVSACPVSSPGTVAVPYTSPISALPSGNARCNSAAAPGGVESAARSLSADNAASAVGGGIASAAPLAFRLEL